MYVCVRLCPQERTINDNPHAHRRATTKDDKAYKDKDWGNSIWATAFRISRPITETSSWVTDGLWNIVRAHVSSYSRGFSKDERIYDRMCEYESASGVGNRNYMIGLLTHPNYQVYRALMVKANYKGDDGMSTICVWCKSF